MEYVRLSNGVEMPSLGYGVYLVSPQECERCVSEALSLGYRLIDTAQAYYNEEGVGQAWSRSGIARQEIFLTTKVWLTNAGEENAAASIERSLQKLKTDYIDLLLIHQPFNDVFGTWRAMEKAYHQGKVRAIGVSNFQAGRFYDFAKWVDIKPMVNQLQCNTAMQQWQIQPILDEYGTRTMAWGPLGGEGSKDVIDNPILASIGSRYGKTAAQVALRFLTQRGIIAIPKSTKPERMAQNLDIFDITLSSEEMQTIKSLNQNDSGIIPFTEPSFAQMLFQAYTQA